MLAAGTLERAAEASTPRSPTTLSGDSSYRPDGSKPLHSIRTCGNTDITS